MKSSSINIEKNRIYRLRREYIEKGFDVIVNPSYNQLPDFLKNFNYIPDLIAKSSKINYIIEVKTFQSLNESIELKEIADVVKQQENWEFVFVVTNSKVDKSIDAIFNLEEITNAVNNFIEFSENRELSQYNDMAYLFGWSILQALLNEKLLISNRKISPTPRSLILAGVTSGILTKYDFKKLNELVDKRNSLTHGDFSIRAANDDILILKNIILRLFNELSNKEDNNDNYLLFLSKLDKESLDVEIDSLIADTNFEIIDSDEVSEIIAQTNAYAYSVDDYEILEIEFIDDTCVLKLRFTAHGEQDSDKFFYGSRISGFATAIINKDGDIEYKDISATIDNI